MANRLLGILWHKALKLALGLFVLKMRRSVRENTAANSAQALEEVISTIRTASIRGFGGSTANNVGGSPFSTQRQNFRSAVTTRC